MFITEDFAQTIKHISESILYDRLRIKRNLGGTGFVLWFTERAWTVVVLRGPYRIPWYAKLALRSALRGEIES